MRTEATLEQWGKLYEAATRIKELKPWEEFWDMDIIAVQTGEEEDTVFYSILGHGGECYGVAVYEGYEGLNKFWMLSMQEQLNLSVEYAMFEQKNLTCYWGNREELTEKQRKIIKDLGYKYRGKNQWMYFQSFEPGYYPYNLDQDEVLRMTEHMKNLNLALEHYEKYQDEVDFANANMFWLGFDKDKNSWSSCEKPLPFTSFQFGNLIIQDEELLEDLSQAPKCEIVLEADVSSLGACVNDKKYKRPANPGICMIADTISGMMLKCELQEPEEDFIASLAEEVIGFIFHFGAPKEIRVSNVIVEAGLEQICEVCNIKLRRVKRLKAIEEFRGGMRQFM